MSKHTPGPWVISYTHDDNLSIAIDDDPGIQGERNYDLVTVTHGDPDELLANARLISAAPELLDALKSMLNLGNLGAYERADAVKAARAAVAKATGL